MSTQSEEEMIVYELAQVMRERLRKHSSGKRHWTDVDPGELLAEARNHMHALDDAVTHCEHARVLKEAADVANYLAMVVARFIDPGGP